jgi:hypothetical protein
MSHGAVDFGRVLMCSRRPSSRKRLSSLMTSFTKCERMGHQPASTLSTSHRIIKARGSLKGRITTSA